MSPPWYGPMDYRCVRQFQQWRLLSVVSLNVFHETFKSLIHETDAFLSVEHLRQLVEQGLWADALSYLSHFLLPTTCRQSDEAQVLVSFLNTHKDLANIEAGNMDDKGVQYLTASYKQYTNHDSTVCFGAVRIRSIILSMLHSEQVRASLDWELVRSRAGFIVYQLAYRTPELRDLVFKPRGPMMPQNVLPIGSGFRPRRHVKQGRRRASAIAKVYLDRRRRIPCSSDHQEFLRGLSIKTRSWLADLVGKTTHYSAYVLPWLISISRVRRSAQLLVD